MTKTVLMVSALAGVFLFGSACFGLFSRKPAAKTAVEACAGLSGDALADCERRHADE